MIFVMLRYVFLGTDSGQNVVIWGATLTKLRPSLTKVC